MGYADVAWGVNELRNTFYGGVQEFLNSGSFTVPDDVYKIYVTACAGGASGGCIESDDNYHIRGGNAGQFIYRKPFLVTPKQQINITIGNGGTPVVSKGQNKYLAKPGANTVIGNLITLKGGTVNLYNNNGAPTAGRTNTNAIEIDNHKYSVVSINNYGENSPFNIGGRAFEPYIWYKSSNYYISETPSGGAASLGKGGDAGNITSYNGTIVNAQDGDKGSGGGGGGYSHNRYDEYPYLYRKPGNGGKGYCLIEW